MSSTQSRARSARSDCSGSLPPAGQQAQAAEDTDTRCSRRWDEIDGKVAVTQPEVARVIRTGANSAAAKQIDRLTGAQHAGIDFWQPEVVDP